MYAIYSPLPLTGNSDLSAVRTEDQMTGVSARLCKQNSLARDNSKPATSFTCWLVALYHNELGTRGAEGSLIDRQQLPGRSDTASEGHLHARQNFLSLGTCTSGCLTPARDRMKPPVSN